MFKRSTPNKNIFYGITEKEKKIIDEGLRRMERLNKKQKEILRLLDEVYPKSLEKIFYLKK